MTTSLEFVGWFAGEKTYRVGGELMGLGELRARARALAEKNRAVTIHPDPDLDLHFRTRAVLRRAGVEHVDQVSYEKALEQARRLKGAGR